jgi:hypothetical protein
MTIETAGSSAIAKKTADQMTNRTLAVVRGASLRQTQIIAARTIPCQRLEIRAVDATWAIV